MSTNSRTKVLVAAVIFLLLTNIAVLLVFFGVKGPEKRSGHGSRGVQMKEFLQKDIGFTPLQLQQYDTLNQRHRNYLKSLFDEMKDRRTQQFRELGRKAFSDTAILQAAENTAARQKEMEMDMIRHFGNIRKLCTPGQQTVFDSLIYKIWDKKDKKRNNLQPKTTVLPGRVV